MPVSGVNPNAAMALQAQAQMAAQSMLSNPSHLESAFDPRGIKGSMARGDNVYMGGLPNAPGAGRPRNPTPTHADMSDPAMQGALQRRMQQYGEQSQQHEIAAKRRGAG